MRVIETERARGLEAMAHNLIEHTERAIVAAHVRGDADAMGAVLSARFYAREILREHKREWARIRAGARWQRGD